MKYQWVRQQGAEDCAAASLAIVTKYYGRNFTINRIREALGTGQKGTTLLGLKNGAQALGFIAKGLQASDKFLESLDQIPLPAILYWKGYHFVVLYEKKEGKYVISDPGIGIRYLDYDELIKGWQGKMVLLLKPHPLNFLVVEDDQMSPFSSFLKRLYPFRFSLIILFGISLLLSGLGLVTPILWQVLIDDALIPLELNILGKMAIAFLVLELCQSLIEVPHSYFLNRFSQRLQLGLTSDFGQQILHLPLTYHESRRTHTINLRLSDIGEINSFITNIVISLPITTLMGILAIFIVIYYSPAMMAIAVLVAIILNLLMIIFRHPIEQLSYKSVSMAGENLFILSQIFKNALLVKTVAASSQLEQELSANFEKEFEVNINNNKTLTLIDVVLNNVFKIAQITILIFGSFLVIKQSLTIGQLIAIQSINMFFLSAVKTWVNVVLNFSRIKGMTQLLDELFQYSPENQGDELLSWVNILPSDNLICDNITFSYAGQVPLFKNFSVNIPSGRVIAIIGESGCGKSTLAKILTRLYSIEAGQILIGEHNFKDIPLDAIRKQIALIPQDAQFLTRSIRDNFKLANPMASLADIIKICELTEADKFIQQLPDKYNTILGDFSANLSGGQKQRLAIARSLLLNPPILILDESTSNLDPPTQRRILDNLLKLRQGQTTIFISHRPKVVNLAEWILFMENGDLKFAGSISDFKLLFPQHLDFLAP